MISLFKNTLSYRWVIMWQRSFHLIGPEALFSLNYEFSSPRFFVLGRAKDHLDWCSLSSIRLKFSCFRVYCKLDARITGKVSIKFSIGLISIGKFELNTCWLIDCCNNLKFIIN